MGDNETVKEAAHEVDLFVPAAGWVAGWGGYSMMQALVKWQFGILTCLNAKQTKKRCGFHMNRPE